jgi:hypothetical protein
MARITGRIVILKIKILGGADFLANFKRKNKSRVSITASAAGFQLIIFTSLTRKVTLKASKSFLI